MNTVRSLMLLLPLLALGGCLDYTEEVTVNRDGTGRLRTEVAVLAEFMTDEDAAEMRQGLDEAAAELAKHPDVSKVEVDDRREGLKHHFVFDVHAKRYQALPDIVNGQDWLQFEELEGKQLRFVRVLDEGGSSAKAYATSGRRMADVGRADDVARALVGRGLLRRAEKRGVNALAEEELDFHVTFKLRAPKVVASNGEVTGGEATWRYRLEELEDKAPGRLTADLDLSRSYLLPAALVFSFGFVFLFLRKKWQRRAY